MEIIKKIFLSLFLLHTIFAIEVEYREAYYDKDNQSNILCRPKINEDNKIISSEVYTTIVDWYDGIPDDGIILFEKFYQNESSRAYLINNGFDDMEGKTIQCNAGLASWSWQNPSWMYSIEIENSEPKKEAIKVDLIEFKNLDGKDSLITNSINIIKNSNAKKLFKFKDADLQFASDIMQFKYIPFKDNENEKYLETFFYLYLDKNKKIQFKSNALNYKNSKSEVLPSESLERLFGQQPKGTSEFNFYIQDFDVVQKWNKDWNRRKESYNVVIQMKNQEKQKIYFLCNTDGYANKFIPLYPSNEFETKNQMQPLFNATGDKIAFLNYSTPKLYDLYVVDISDCGDCGRFSESYHNSPLDLDYNKIDGNIVIHETFDDMSDGMNNFNSYCWHPSRNIIFYVKRETDADGAIRYPIYYYDFDDKKSKPIKMDILTDNNKYLSMSNDGQFLLFSFRGVRDGINKSSKHFRNSNDAVLYKSKTHAIGLAKLIYD